MVKYITMRGALSPSGNIVPLITSLLALKCEQLIIAYPLWVSLSQIEGLLEVKRELLILIQNICLFKSLHHSGKKVQLKFNIHIADSSDIQIGHYKVKFVGSLVEIKHFDFNTVD